MVDQKISDLAAVSSVADTNEFAVNEAGTSKKATALQIRTHAIAGTLAEIAGQTLGTEQIFRVDDVGAIELTPLTNFAATVLDDTTASAAVDTLGGAASSGSGGLVRITNAALTTPNIGTPSAGTLTNCTGLPTAGLVNDAVTYAKIQDVSATDRLLGRSTAGAGDVEEITCTAAGRALIDDADAAAQRTTLGVGAIGQLATLGTGFSFCIDGGGSAITTGVKHYIPIPYAFTITGWDIVADVSGSIVVDVWKDTYANFPPVVGDTIAGSEKPTLSSAQKNQDLTLSTWTTSVAAGDVLGINVDSATTVTKVWITLRGTRTA